MNILSGREGHLAFDSEIGPNSIVALDGMGVPIFKFPPLVFVEDLSDYTSKRSAMSLDFPKIFSHSEREAQRNYMAMAETLRISASVWNSAFAWVNGHVSDAETAKKVLVQLINGQRKEVDKDPYSLVRARRMNQHTLENRPVRIEYFGGKYFVAKVRPTSNADLAGVRVGMQLKSIGENEVTPNNLQSALEQYGKDPSLIAHFIGRDGSALDIPHWGKEKPLPGTHGYVLPMKDGAVGVLEILSFNTLDVCSSVRLQLHNFRNQNIKALIVDLRHNSGGLVDPVRCIGGLLFGDDKLMARMTSIRDDVVSYELRSNNLQILKPMPMIFLIDAATASSSEILAGSAREMGSVWIVGLRSFGKGIAQDVTPLYIEGDLIDGFDQLRTTVRYEFASGFSPQLQGIKPDILVDSSVPGIDGEAIAVRFEDRFGQAFKGSERETTSDPVRQFQLKRLRACVGRKMIFRRWRKSPELERWFADRQLRAAGLAAECEMANYFSLRPTSTVQ